MKKPSIAIYFGHDAAIAVSDPQNHQIVQIEIDKVAGFKHYQLRPPSPQDQSPEEIERYYAELDHIITNILHVLKRDFGINNDFELILTKNYYYRAPYARTLKSFTQRLKHEKVVTLDRVQHHRLHCKSAYLQSPFDKAIIFSFDGGGDDGTSARMGMVNQTPRFEHHTRIPVGRIFSNVCHQLRFSHTIDISLVDKMVGPARRSFRMDHSGKMMGLASYGSPNAESFETFTWFIDKIFPYSQQNRTDFWDPPQNGQFSWPADQLILHYKKRFDFPLTLKDEILIAAEIQTLSEIIVKKEFETHILPIAEKYDNNIVLSGGCAMNVVINQKIREWFPHLNVYVPPNPGDSGLPLGMLSEYFRESLLGSVSHLSDVRLLDLETVPSILKERGATVITTEDLLTSLNSGEIVGFIDGGIEIGPRSLCRRSILASAKYDGMKDKINAKVKNREWFRPFAPVTRDVDVKKYFHGPYTNLQTMSYCLDTRSEWRDTLVAINHVDNTARVQVLEPSESPFIYDLISKMEEPKVLLNTSFNVGGKPILNTMKDALWVLDNRDLDHVIIVHENQLWKITK